MKRLIPFISVILCLQANAQNEIDALRYGRTYPGGTARSTAMGGAFSAAGADFYSASINPAGLGLYRNGNEMTFTPEFHYSEIDARYYGSERSDSKLNFNINNFGYVSSWESNESGFIGGSLAFGFNRINNFHSNIAFSGVNRYTSMAHAIKESANNGGNPWPVDQLLPYDEWLFYDGVLIDDDAAGFYHVNEDILYSIDSIGSGLRQTQYTESSGRMNEWVFAAGFNFNHILYFGASLGITPVRYKEEIRYDEDDGVDASYEIFDFYNSMDTRGTGFNGKFGLILRPIHFFRIGASVQTATSYDLEMTYDAHLQSRYADWMYLYPRDEQGNILDYGESNFTLITPAKYTAGLSFTVGKFATINADIESINYSKMRFKGMYDDNANDVIRNIYDQVYNIRAGAEFRISQLYLRAGGSYLPSPFVEDELNGNADQYIGTGGIGFRTSDFFFDFTYTYMWTDERYTLYYAEGRPSTANYDIKRSRFMTTFGFKF